jgi:hypothetical protein
MREFLYAWNMFWSAVWQRRAIGHHADMVTAECMRDLHLEKATELRGAKR